MSVRLIGLGACVMLSLASIEAPAQHSTSFKRRSSLTSRGSQHATQHSPPLTHNSALTTHNFVRAAQPSPSPRELLGLAISQFERHQVTESATTFDRLVEAAPQLMPNLWQRGIAQYYAGRYDDCRKQFESHRTVNPNDVENAVWHFLCVARSSTPERARVALLPVGPDSRVPMRQVYELFGGRTTPEAVLAAGGTTPSSQFFANLYVGLYYEAIGNASKSLEHMTIAAEERFATAGDYMHLVAEVHLRQRKSPR